MANEKGVRFDGERIQEELKKREIKSTVASQFIILRSPNYLYNCFAKNTIGEESLKKLCGFLGLDIKEVMIDDEEPEKESKKQFNYDDLIVGLNSMYNLQNKILAEIKNQNEILRGLSSKKTQDSEMMKQINSNVNTATEKVKAIFTEIKYSK